VHRVAIDLGREMLVDLGERWGSTAPAVAAPARILGDVARPPLASERFGVVAGLGNLLGFAEGGADDLLATLLDLVAPGGTLLLEIAPGPGERSRYLSRLPETAVARLMRSPTAVVAPRVAREGFREDAPRKRAPGPFRRFTAGQLAERLAERRYRLEETLAVAPALGPDAGRLARVARDPKAWDHLLELEEVLGRDPGRWGSAAAVLVAAVAPPRPGD
jgi:hypothetical protein